MDPWAQWEEEWLQWEEDQQYWENARLQFWLEEHPLLTEEDYFRPDRNYWLPHYTFRR